MWRFVKKEILLWLGFLFLGTAGFFFTITLPQAEGFYAFLLTTSLAGFGVAFTIYYGKRYQKQLACPTGESCNEVVNSPYSKLLGIPIEYMGMLYYFTMILTYGFFTQSPAFSSYAPLAVLLSTLAFLFSVYLTGVQAFILNRWCIWCLLSGALSTSIFLASLVSIEGIASILANNLATLDLLKTLGYALGIGGSTAGIFIFSRFLDDFDIDKKESAILQETSGLIWLGLLLTLGSEYLRHIAFTETLAQSPLFIMQMLALTLASLAGAVLLVVFAPFLSILPFTKTGAKKLHRLKALRNATFLAGAVAVSSWYYAFLTNYLPVFGLGILLTLYFFVIAIAIALAQWWQHRIARGRVEKGPSPA